MADIALTAPAATAEAVSGPVCSDDYRNAARDYFCAYDGADCAGLLGRTNSYDSNGGNSSGPFQGGDTNRVGGGSRGSGRTGCRSRPPRPQ
ncbi:hypothetical protein [Streptomyces sp. URMC 129]|uniref:hypothetical protein n=1 Tax=Streptomyces sp. URMC 129 TaxID=3423407 RepID=UPI003F1C8057